MLNIIRRFFLLFFILFSTNIGAESISFVFTDYAPANYVDERGNYSGFLYEITKEAFESRLGITLDITILPWRRCQQLVKNGVFDMMLTIPTDERLVYSIATESPVWIKKRYIYSYINHEDIENINTLNGLDEIKQYGYRIVSYIGNQWFRDNVEAFDIPVVYASSVEGMYYMLAAKRADFLIEEISIASSNIEKLDLEDKIIQTGGIAVESGFHLLISKKSSFTSIIDELDRVLEDMWNDGTIERILNDYGTR